MLWCLLSKAFGICSVWTMCMMLVQYALLQQCYDALMHTDSNSCLTVAGAAISMFFAP